MIEYVDRLLAHWAQEFSVRDAGLSLGYQPGWCSPAITEVGVGSARVVTARGTASRPTMARAGVGRVAERVNQAVEKLPEHLKATIKMHYLERPELIASKKADNLKISLRTFHKYIHRAHEVISADLPDSYVHWRIRESVARAAAVR